MIDNPSEKPATVAEMAAIEFEAWQHTQDDWRPPSDEEWTTLAEQHIVVIRIAWAMMLRTKPEFIEELAAIGDEALAETLNHLAETEDFFRGVLGVLEAAHARALSASAALILRDAEKPAEDKPAAAP